MGKERTAAVTAALTVREIPCRSILTKSGIEGVDYAVNPYVGCEHGCVYCYAIFMKRFTGHGEPWGTFVDVKVNAAEVLRKQLQRARAGNVTFGTVTDAYQPLEEHYGITRACLEALQGRNWPLCILTKSDLVLRDLDLLAGLDGVEVAFTIHTLDDRLRKQFEPRASPIRARLEALNALAEAGIPTWAFCGPLLPRLSDGDAEVHALFGELKRVGVRSVYVDSLNLRGAVWSRILGVLETAYPELVPYYRAIRDNRRPYHEAMMERVRTLAARHGLSLRTS